MYEQDGGDKMKTYEVRLYVHGYILVTVQAANEEDAEQIAFDAAAWTLPENVHDYTEYHGIDITEKKEMT